MDLKYIIPAAAILYVIITVGILWYIGAPIQ